MNNLKLSVPTDVPWRRLAVSNDMLDPILCDQERPPSFRSSLVAFRYDPAEEYQPFDELTVSYVKVVATVGPYSPDMALGDVQDFLPPHVVDEIEDTYPCYGAVLQIAVAPPQGTTGVELGQYPYIADFEPKKRELYEIVTDTGELLSGSTSNLSVGKSSTSTQSQEYYDMDLGGAGGNVGVAWGLVSAGGNDKNQQVGTIARRAGESTQVQTSDTSTERRELQSHTTQLTQMYTLLQGFHLGTNRAVFLLEPRPHVRQMEATFVNGPRALEGMQEVFLVVARPKTMADFCVSVLLETAHVTYEEAITYETATQTWSIRINPKPVPVDDKGKPEQAQITGDDIGAFYFPSGWELDSSKGTSSGFSIKIIEKKNVTKGPTFKADASKITASLVMKPTGKLHVDVTVYLRKKDAEVSGTVRRLFLSARELCTCPPPGTRGPDARAETSAEWISFDHDITAKKVPIHRGQMSRSAFLAGRRFASVVHGELIRSFGSSRRKPRGGVRYADSDAFYSRFIIALAASSASSRLSRPLATLPGLDAAARGRLEREMSCKTIGDLLLAEGDRAARVLGVDQAAFAEIRRDALRALAAREP